MAVLVKMMTLRRALASLQMVVTLCALLLSVGNGEAVNNEGEREGEGESLRSSKLAVIEFRAFYLYPESFDWDAKHSRFLVGSMGRGKLVTVTLDGVVEEFAVFDEANRDAAIVGVTIDVIRNRVLAAVHGMKGPPLNVLVAYDLDSRERTLFVNLGDEARALLENQELGEGRASNRDLANGVAVDLEGNAYVTNSGGNYIWKVTVEGLKTVLVPSIPQLPVIAEMEMARASGTNGIVYTDGYLLISQSNSGAIFRVRIDDDHHQDERLWAVKIKDGQAIPGADDLALRPDGSLVVVSVDAAWLLISKDSWRTATIVDKVPLNETDFTTSAALIGQRVFTVQLQAYDFFKGIDRELFTIREVAFPYDVDNNPLWLLVIAAAFIVLILAWKFQVKQFNKAYTKKRL